MDSEWKDYGGREVTMSTGEVDVGHAESEVSEGSQDSGDEHRS